MTGQRHQFALPAAACGGDVFGTSAAEKLVRQRTRWDGAPATVVAAELAPDRASMLVTVLVDDPVPFTVAPVVPLRAEP